MHKAALIQLIDIESKKIIKDVFEYLPIRGLLTQVIPFNHIIVVKRKWIIEKIEENKNERYPVSIKDLTFVNKKEKETVLIFHIKDQSFKDKTSFDLSYELFCRFSIGDNSSEYDHVNSIDLRDEDVEWNEHDQGGSITYFSNNKFDSSIYVENTKDNIIISTCITEYTRDQEFYDINADYNIIDVI